MPITDTAAAAPAAKKAAAKSSVVVDDDELAKAMDRLSLYSGHNLKPNEQSMLLPTKKWCEYVTGNKSVMFETHCLSGVPGDNPEQGGDITVESSPNRKAIVIRHSMPSSHPWRSEAQWARIDATYGDPNHANTTSRCYALQAVDERTNGGPAYVQIIPTLDDATLTGHIDLDMPLIESTKNAVIQARNQRYALLRIQARVAEAPLSVGVSPGAPRMV